MPPVQKGDWKFTAEPNELIVFDGNLQTAETKMDLKLTNASDKKRAFKQLLPDFFKVKCTSNDMFRIRPPVGKVDAGETITIGLTLHQTPKDKIPADGTHLFSIYHIPMPETGDDAPRKVWADHQGDSEGMRRIPVNFVNKDKDVDKPDEGAAEKKEEEKKEDKKETPAAAPAAETKKDEKPTAESTEPEKKP